MCPLVQTEHRFPNPIGHIISLATVLTRLAYAPRESPCPCMRHDTCTACSHWRTSSCSTHDNAIRDTPCLSFPRRYCTSNSGHLQQRDRQVHWLFRSGPTLSVELHTPSRRAESVAARPSYQTDSTNLQPQRKNTALMGLLLSWLELEAKPLTEACRSLFGPEFHLHSNKTKRRPSFRPHIPPPLSLRPLPGHPVSRNTCKDHLRCRPCM